MNATEGYGSALRQVGRRILPLYSLMIATEPLCDAVWDRIGIEHGQTFTDFRHLIIYGQRTADNRFAFGGRGARAITWPARSGRPTTASAASRTTCGKRSSTSSPRRRMPGSPTNGAARSESPATGTPPSDSMPAARRPGQAATSATG